MVLISFSIDHFFFCCSVVLNCIYSFILCSFHFTLLFDCYRTDHRCHHHHHHSYTDSSHSQFKTQYITNSLSSLKSIIIALSSVIMAHSVQMEITGSFSFIPFQDNHSPLISVYLSNCWYSCFVFFFWHETQNQQQHMGAAGWRVKKKKRERGTIALQMQYCPLFRALSGWLLHLIGAERDCFRA